MDLMIYICSTVISSEDFDILSGLCLNQGFEIFEVSKNLRFFPDKVDPCKMSKIINKNEKKPHFFDGWMRKRTHKVILDHI
jgi:hypothetical protein